MCKKVKIYFATKTYCMHGYLRETLALKETRLREKTLSQFPLSAQ